MTHIQTRADVFTPRERRLMRWERRRTREVDGLFGPAEEDFERGHDGWDLALSLAAAPLLALAVWSHAWIGWWAALAVAFHWGLLTAARRLRRPAVRPDAWTFRSKLGSLLLARRWRRIPRRFRLGWIALSSAALLGSLAALWGALTLTLWAVALGVALEWAAGLSARDVMVRLVEDQLRAGAA